MKAYCKCGHPEWKHYDNENKNEHSDNACDSCEKNGKFCEKFEIVTAGN